MGAGVDRYQPGIVPPPGESENRCSEASVALPREAKTGCPRANIAAQMGSGTSCSQGDMVPGEGKTGCSQGNIAVQVGRGTGCSQTNMASAEGEAGHSWANMAPVVGATRCCQEHMVTPDKSRQVGTPPEIDKKSDLSIANPRGFVCRATNSQRDLNASGTVLAFHTYFLPSIPKSFLL